MHNVGFYRQFEFPGSSVNFSGLSALRVPPNLLKAVGIQYHWSLDCIRNDFLDEVQGPENIYTL